MDSTAPILTVGFYAGLNGLVLAGLATHVGNTRRRLRIPIGDGGNPEMVRAMRGQLNFVELVPFCLIQIVLLALVGVPLWLLHLFCASLTLGRISHASHFMQSDAPGWQRAAGALLTAVVLVGTGLCLIGLGARRLF